jgi:hypothetical protein
MFYKVELRCASLPSFFHFNEPHAQRFFCLLRNSNLSALWQSPLTILTTDDFCQFINFCSVSTHRKTLFNSSSFIDQYNTYGVVNMKSKTSFFFLKRIKKEKIIFERANIEIFSSFKKCVWPRFTFQLLCIFSFSDSRLL